MGQFTLPGNPPIPVVLRKSARARRISLRVSQLDGRVTVTLPTRVPEREAIAFVRDKERWLRGHLDRHEGPVEIAPGTVVPLRGAPLTVVQGQGRRILHSADTLTVPGPAETMPARLRGWLREQARNALAEASDRHSAALGRRYARITLRDTRSRWGSCTADGALMYSWRLILTPPEVLDYVAAHEVAHLRHMDHSAAFWDTVRGLYGDWRSARAWLRDNGAALHRYRFDD
ncbi:MAG: M48 family metallopeptidase [Roseivivax sp.]|nr:M48 family metallopeptidase [Roseivivax sp.]